MATAVVAVLAATTLTGTPLMHTSLIVRDVVGLTGLTALTAVATGAPLAWLTPTMWTLTAVSISPGAQSPWSQVLTWPMQPPDTTTATLTAIVLAISGGVAYTASGCRR